ncbi:aquaporin-3-like isoform X2 [Scyliorhinus torazame]|uniref:aquaporin-3-like isoform X2 n=1 Tax=Scyliorhinus torazame TaxID=75743 RepID=UPI003B58E76B
MGRAAAIAQTVHNALQLRNRLFRECLAEFLGVCMLILFGCGAVAQMVVSNTTRGEFLSVNLGFGLGATFGIYIAGGISDGIHAVNNGTLSVTGPRATAFIFGTYPAPFLTLSNGFIDQLIGTATLLLCIFAVLDGKNNGAPKVLQPIFIGLSVVGIGMSMGSNSGYAINPARDFGPRLLTLAAGWGTEVFTAGNSWWWIPIVAPMVGAVLGALAYELLVELHHLQAQDECEGREQTDQKLKEVGGCKEGPACRRDPDSSGDQFVMAM